MSFRWTEALAEPVAAMTREGEWRRVDETRDGGWLLLSDGTEEDVCWYRAQDGNGCPVKLDPLEDDKLPIRTVVGDWLRRGHEIHLLAWRVRRRAIFRVRSVSGSRICKLYHRDRQVLDRWRALSALENASWSVPRVLEWNPQRLLLTMEDRGGVSLNHRWLSGRGVPSDGDSVTEALSWLESASIPDGFPSYDLESEARLLERRLEESERALSRPPAAARGLVQRVLARLREDPARGTVFCHRDLHDKQMLLNGKGGTLIDLDLAAAGPPGLDPGNILAHLHLRALKGARLPWRNIAGRIVDGCMVSRGIEDSLHRWTAAALMRLALIYSRRRRPPLLLENLLASTEQALERQGDWAKILKR